MNNWFLFPLSKLETGISNFSFYSRNPRSEFHISLSTLEIRDQNLKFLLLLSKFEIRISNFSFYSRNSRSELQISLSTLEIRDQNLKFLFLLSNLLFWLSSMPGTHANQIFGPIDPLQCIVARTIPNWAFLLQGICFSCLGSFVMQWAISKAPFKRAMPQLPHWSLCEVQLHDAYNRSVFCTAWPIGRVTTVMSNTYMYKSNIQYCIIITPPKTGWGENID